MRNLIDTHAHLSDFKDQEKILENARNVGIDAIIGVSVNLETSKSTLECAKIHHKYVFPAIGIHPTEWTGEEIQPTLNFLEDKISECVAIGEIGLDYWNKNARKNKRIREIQREFYINQLKKASEYNKPVSVHGRGSWQDVLDLARTHGPDRVVFHWYSGPTDILKGILDSGYLISATPASEYSSHHRKALTETPLESILIETDAPVYLKNRNRNSEPADLLITVKALSKLKKISEKEIIKTTKNNTERFFNI